MIDIQKIIKALDAYIIKEGKTSIGPSEGNIHLASIELLPNYDRSGSQLRELCRDGLIPFAKQPGGKGTKWIISNTNK